MIRAAKAIEIENDGMVYLSEAMNSWLEEVQRNEGTVEIIPSCLPKIGDQLLSCTTTGPGWFL